MVCMTNRFHHFVHSSFLLAMLELVCRHENNEESSDDGDIILPPPPEHGRPVEEVEDEEEDGKEAEEDQVRLGELGAAAGGSQYTVQQYTVTASTQL